MARVTTGLRPLDDLIGGLRVGDNLVLELDRAANGAPFVDAFIRASATAPALAYVTFRAPPAEILDRHGDRWDPERFLLVDGFTDGLGEGATAGFYRSRRARTVRVARLRDVADPRATREAVTSLGDELGRGARYVFDDVTEMQRLWGADAALASFLTTCPRLFELRTVALWLLERPAHSQAFLTQLQRITQVALRVDSEGDARTIGVLKAEGRSPEVPGRRIRARFEDDRLRVLHEAGDERRRFGAAIRSHRVRRGLSQAELARRVGISPSALSQAERGRAGLSAQTVARLADVLEVPFPGTEQAGRSPLEVSRRGARLTTRTSEGVTGELLFRTADGGEVHLLSFAPTSVGRKAPFATKRDEVVVVLEGVLELRIGRAAETLHAGDGALIVSEPVSGWRNPGPEAARVLWTVFP